MLRFKRRATLGERFGAFVMDHMIISVLFVGVLLTFILELEDPSNVGIVIAFLFFTPLIYILKDMIGGRSIGKRVFGIHVRHADDPMTVPTMGHLMLRNISLIFWPIEVFVLLFSPNQQRLGDILAKTDVVKLYDDYETSRYDTKDYDHGYYEREDHKNDTLKTSDNAAYKVAAILFLVVTFVVLIFATIIYAMTHNGAYLESIRMIEATPLVTDQVGEIEGYGIIPTGNVSLTNGDGNADLRIKVKGSLDDVYVRVILYKRDGGSWYVNRLKIE